MKLSEWFETPEGSQVSKADFARSIGVTPQMVSAYCKDRMWPGRERMEFIVRETKGAVTANDFINMNSAEAAQ